jgi:N-acetylmuramoyl-L-alanine amidase
MEMTMSKRLIFLICFLVLGFSAHLGTPVSNAEEKTSLVIKVRAAKYPEYIRVVFTSDDFVLRNAAVILTKNKTVKIDFRSVDAAAAAGMEKQVLSLETEKGVGISDIPIEIIKSVRLVVKGDSCLVTVPDVETIKVLRLQAPSRIVIDAYFTAAPKDTASSVPVIKPVAEQMAFRYLVIDAGHGGYDYGIRTSHFAEKDFVLAFARELSGILAKSGKEVILTRKIDQVMSISERINLVNKKPPDILISLHVSSTKVPTIYTIPTIPERADGSAGPVEEKTNDQKKTEMARGVADAIAKNIEKEFSIGVARDTLPLTLLMRSKAPAVLIELPNPEQFSYEKKNKERLLSAIIRGLAVGTKEEKLPAPFSKPDNRPENKNEKKTASKPEKP